MSGRRGFLCAGCWTLDRVKLVDRWPAEETLAMIGAIERQGGGSAHNVAIDLRKLDPGMPVATIGLVGRDADGDFLVATARAHGVDVAQLHRSDQAQTSFTDVMTVRGTARRTFFHHTGTNDLLTPEHFRFDASDARILHLGLLGVHARLDGPWRGAANGWVAVLEAARAAGLETSIELVSIDPERNRALALPCLPHLDYLVVNDQEIGALAGIETIVAADASGDAEAGVGSGRSGDRGEPAAETDGKRELPDAAASRADPERCLEAAERVLAMGTMRVVVAHYPAGAVAVTRAGERLVLPSLALDPASIVGSVGAGDAFAAGVLYALHEGWEVDGALRLGHAVAAMSLRSATTVGSVGTLAECMALAGLDRPTAGV